MSKTHVLSLFQKAIKFNKNIFIHTGISACEPLTCTPGYTVHTGSGDWPNSLGRVVKSLILVFQAFLELIEDPRSE